MVEDGVDLLAEIEGTERQADVLDSRRDVGVFRVDTDEFGASCAAESLRGHPHSWDGNASPNLDHDEVSFGVLHRLAPLVVVVVLAVDAVFLHSKV